MFCDFIFAHKTHNYKENILKSQDNMIQRKRKIIFAALKRAD